MRLAHIFLCGSDLFPFLDVQKQPTSCDENPANGFVLFTSELSIRIWREMLAGPLVIPAWLFLQTLAFGGTESSLTTPSGRSTSFSLLATARGRL
jgi:hypothetical protein